MLTPENLTLLTHSLDDEEVFQQTVGFMEADSLFFNIDEYEELIEEEGYSSMLENIAKIISILMEMKDQDLLQKMFWLNKVVQKKAKQAILMDLFSYPYEELLEMSEETREELQEKIQQATHEYYADYQFEKQLYCFQLDCMNNLQGKELKQLEVPEAGLLEKLFSLTEIAQDSFAKLMFERAVHSYCKEIKSIFKMEKKKKLAEKKEEEIRKQVYQRLFPEYMEGQMILASCEESINQTVEEVLHQSRQKIKVKKEKEVSQSQENSYEQMSIFL